MLFFYAQQAEFSIWLLNVAFASESVGMCGAAGATKFICEIND